MKTVADTLRMSRLEARISQRALAKTIGISSAYLCQVETGVHTLSPRWYPLLPEPVRTAVIAAKIREHEAAIIELRRLAKQEKAP
jgi:DNA-binding XRE family transcriptional regulator